MIEIFCVCFNQQSTVAGHTSHYFFLNYRQLLKTNLIPYASLHFRRICLLQHDNAACKASVGLSCQEADWLISYLGLRILPIAIRWSIHGTVVVFEFYKKKISIFIIQRRNLNKYCSFFKFVVQKRIHSISMIKSTKYIRNSETMHIIFTKAYHMI